MGIGAATAAYEAWLRTRCAVVETDLKRKHALMREAAFPFLRATYYRWAGRIEVMLPRLAAEPSVLAVGDAHVENFGTWRDAEGRPVWGVNDFDEAAGMPWPFDLVRLATSARLVPEGSLSKRDTAAAILDDYEDGLNTPRPALLDKRDMAPCPPRRVHGRVARPILGEAGRPVGRNPTGARARGPARSPARARFVTATPGGAAEWYGRKAVVPSAWDWAHGHDSQPGAAMALAAGAFRAPDAWFVMRGGWVVRRLAADGRKAEPSEDASKALRAELPQAVGSEVGVLHAAFPARAVVGASLATFPRDWLRRSANGLGRRGTGPGGEERSPTNYPRALSATSPQLRLRMLPRVALFLACRASLFPTTLARRVRLTCEVVHDLSGKRLCRTVVIDPDNRILRDNAVILVGGAANPLSDNLKEFVNVDSGRIIYLREPGEKQQRCTTRR